MIKPTDRGMFLRELAEALRVQGSKKPNWAAITTMNWFYSEHGVKFGEHRMLELNGINYAITWGPTTVELFAAVYWLDVKNLHHAPSEDVGIEPTPAPRCAAEDFTSIAGRLAEIEREKKRMLTSP